MAPPACSARRARPAGARGEPPPGVSLAQPQPGHRQGGVRMIFETFQQPRRLTGTPLPHAQRGEPAERIDALVARTLLESSQRTQEFLLSSLPTAASRMDGAVIGSARGRENAFPVALDETTDAAPLIRTCKVSHALTCCEHRAVDQPNNPELGDFARRAEGHGGVELAQALAHLTPGDPRQADVRVRQHLAIAVAEGERHVSGLTAGLDGGAPVAAHRRLHHHQPRHLGARAGLLQQLLADAHPAFSRCHVAVHREVLGQRSRPRRTRRGRGALHACGG